VLAFDITPACVLTGNLCSFDVVVLITLMLTLLAHSFIVLYLLALCMFDVHTACSQFDCLLRVWLLRLLLLSTV
jgi:hypothetical protein